ncbi:hypothetical protein [Mediterranea sp. An20]|uniref:hypothetical protein n=1 Tax=Mediterranea sp. An20 TaxID=1965586 RepID=UPI0013A619C7|nr:hypothetical protein [Mediterranea sp. An20]
MSNMKYVLFIAAAALALAACTGDENLNDGPVAIRLSSADPCGIGHPRQCV